MIECLLFYLKRADAARAALNKAREEEYKKRVGMCGVSFHLIWLVCGELLHIPSLCLLQPPAVGLERSTETFCPSEGAKTRWSWILGQWQADVNKWSQRWQNKVISSKAKQSLASRSKIHFENVLILKHPQIAQIVTARSQLKESIH